MFDAAERIADVPVIGARLSFDDSAALDILTVDLGPAATDVRADRRACHGAAGGCNVATASASDLMAEHAANDGTRDRTRNVGRVASFFDDLLALDPAALFRRTDHRTHRRHGNFVESLLRSRAIFVRRRGP